MKKVKRYSPRIEELFIFPDQPMSPMVEDDFGKYVTHADFISYKIENIELRKLVRRMQLTILKKTMRLKNEKK